MSLRIFKIICTLLLLQTSGFSQQNYQFSLNTVNESCGMGSAELELHNVPQGDVVTIDWSSGEHNVQNVSPLSQGDYFVRVQIVHQQDTVTTTTDTTLQFSIGYILCAIQVDKYFSPNDDNYHDQLSIGNIHKYPNFELEIYNRWGQRIHSQKKTYEPWNGKWNGIDLPDGTYYYVFFYDASDKGNVAKGDITILR